MIFFLNFIFVNYIIQEASRPIEFNLAGMAGAETKPSLVLGFSVGEPGWGWVWAQALSPCLPSPISSQWQSRPADLGGEEGEGFSSTSTANCSEIWGKELSLS